jgi:hypothetical protein
MPLNAAHETQGCTVEGYRLYRLDGVAKVASAEWIEADDDQAAIEVAKNMMDGHAWELWHSARLIQRKDGKGRAVTE